jgi:hypothetical protein
MEKSNHRNTDPFISWLDRSSTKGLNDGSMATRSLFDDEKEKMKSDTCCCFCGSTENLSIDHLVPRKKGGIDEGDNLILACRSCNSSKGKKDLMEWYNFKREFPPLLILRRYLKLLIKYCSDQRLMDMNWVEATELDIPFNLKYLPEKFPSPESLIFKHETRLQQTAWGDSFHSCPSSTFC